MKKKEIPIKRLENLNQKQILELKSTITEVRILLHVLKSRFEQVEELANLKIRQWKLQSEEQKEKRLKESEVSLRTSPDTSPSAPINTSWEFKEKREKGRAERILKNGRKLP